jgi:hypothetical protein
MALTRSEELVHRLSRDSFLSVWTYPNPLNSKGKELCDVLVVCDPHVLIFSVKEIEYKDTGRPEVDVERWRRAAIEESSKQIYGAQRAIDQQTSVVSSENILAISFPSSDTRKIHRIAVALGAKDVVPLTFGDFGKGFVHVFDEKSLSEVMRELDTISDFVKYLTDKEEFYTSGKLSLFSGEEDLLALYVAEGYRFPDAPDFIVLDQGLWSAFNEMPGARSERIEQEVSYVWDNILERVFENFSNANYQTSWEPGERTLMELELSVRAMAKENRRMRTHLGRSIVELIQSNSTITNRARICDPTEATVRYVFMVGDYDGNREGNAKELKARCLVARGIEHSKTTVIGVLIELRKGAEGDAVSVCYFDAPEWTFELQERMELYQNELGLFKNLKRKGA